MNNYEPKPTKTALITGASVGIGLELARCFAADGWNLVLIARSEERLREVCDAFATEYSVSATPLSYDLTETDAPQRVFDELKQRKIHIEALVNNAGFGDYGPFAKCDWEKQEKMIALNIAALTNLTRLFLPPMKACKNGKILNIASTAAFFPGPLMSVYYASKAYVLSFSQALANELEGSGVTVSCLCPGATRTEFQERAQMTESRLMQSTMMDAQTVAQIGYAGLLKNKTIIVPGLWNRVLVQAPRVLSRHKLAQIIRRAQDKG